MAYRLEKIEDKITVFGCGEENDFGSAVQKIEGSRNRDSTVVLGQGKQRY